MLGSWRWGTALLGGVGSFYVGAAALSQPVQTTAVAGVLSFTGTSSTSQPVQTNAGTEDSEFSGTIATSQLTQTLSGSASGYNVYCTLAEAEWYVSTLCFSSAWTGKTDNQKRMALVSATRWLDTLPWKGIRTDADQPLQWPRCAEYTIQYSDVNLNGTCCLLDRDGYEIQTDEIPAVIKLATAEMALRLQEEDRAADVGALAPSSLKIGPLDLQNIQRNLFPPSVLELCGYLLKRSLGQCRALRS